MKCSFGLKFPALFPLWVLLVERTVGIEIEIAIENQFNTGALDTDFDTDFDFDLDSKPERIDCDHDNDHDNETPGLFKCNDFYAVLWRPDIIIFIIM
jgi:hypothetical protein